MTFLTQIFTNNSYSRKILMRNFEQFKLRCGGDDLSYVYIGVHLNLGSNPKMQKMFK